MSAETKGGFTRFISLGGDWLVWNANMDAETAGHWEGEQDDAGDPTVVVPTNVAAAAPDLLEALESIENDDGSIPDAVWDMRNRAIAKARGTDR